PLVAQIPVVLPDKKIVEAVLVLFATNDLLVVAVSTLTVRGVYVGARVVRQVKGRIRQYLVTGTPVNFGPLDPPPGAELVVLQDPGKFDGALERAGYRATALPRLKSASGEDLVMPGAIAAEG